MRYTPDEAAVFGALAQPMKAVTCKHIAAKLDWYRISELTPRKKRWHDKRRTLKALNTLKDRGLVEEKLTGVGSRWKLKR